MTDPAPVVGLPDQGGPLIPPSYLDAAKALVARQRTVHQRVACPTCGEPIGRRCIRKGQPRSWYTKDLKHSHLARLNADGIPLR